MPIDPELSARLDSIDQTLDDILRGKTDHVTQLARAAKAIEMIMREVIQARQSLDDTLGRIESLVAAAAAKMNEEESGQPGDGSRPGRRARHPEVDDDEPGDPDRAIIW